MNRIIRKIVQEARMVTKASSLAKEFAEGRDNIRLLELHGSASGMIAYYRYEDDGNLYEVEIRPIQTARHPKPESLRSHNRNEPLSQNDVRDIVTNSVYGLPPQSIISVDSKDRHNRTYFDFEILLDVGRLEGISKADIEKRIEDFVGGAFPLKIVPTRHDNKILVRYRKA